MPARSQAFCPVPPVDSTLTRGQAARDNLWPGFGTGSLRQADMTAFYAYRTADIVGIALTGVGAVGLAASALQRGFEQPSMFSGRSNAPLFIFGGNRHAHDFPDPGGSPRPGIRPDPLPVGHARRRRRGRGQSPILVRKDALEAVAHRQAGLPVLCVETLVTLLAAAERGAGGHLVDHAVQADGPAGPPAVVDAGPRRARDGERA